MNLHTIKAKLRDGRELAITLREPTWGDVKHWAANSLAGFERLGNLIREVDGVPAKLEAIPAKAALVASAFVDRLLAFREDEAGAISASLQERTVGIYVEWTFKARGRIFVVTEPSVAALANAMKSHPTSMRRAFYALADSAITTIDGKPPPPGEAAAIGVDAPIMEFIASLLHDVMAPTEEEVIASHQGAAFAEAP